jgi:pimeloyl-ACP methyl ester carboxylesterase
MPSRFAAVVASLCAAPAVAQLPADPPYYRVEYPPSKQPGELAYGVAYAAWVPPGVKTLRGVIVHQHGCGVGACKGGETAAYDLHWQALARKWDCALLGPSYQQPEKAECAAWSDPRRGSEKAFRRALRDLGAASNHPELERVPWALWGHSGGANWAGTMALLHPDRTAAVWLRSGSPRLMSDGFAVPDAAYGVPMMVNVGAKEKEGRFARVWETTLPFVRDFRAKNAPVGLAVDPRTSHECGDSRYLAVPYLDACLKLRLPDKPGEPLKPIDAARGGVLPDDNGWVPTDAVAKLWAEYVKTGATPDATPPPAPTAVRVAGNVLTWAADADFESGLAGFVVERDGAELARLPGKPVGKFGRPLFQPMSYHDTPEQPLPAMRYEDASAQMGATHEYRVLAVNGAGLRSPAVRATRGP